MQSFDINLLSGALAPSNPSSADQAFGGDFAKALERELAIIEAENAARDAERERDFNNAPDSGDDDDRTYENGNDEYNFASYTPSGNDEDLASDAASDAPIGEESTVTPESANTAADSRENENSEVVGANDSGKAPSESEAANASTVSSDDSGDPVASNAKHVPIVSAPGIFGAAEVVQAVTPESVEPTVVALAASATGAAVAPTAASPAKLTGATSNPTPTAPLLPTTPSATAPQTPILPVQPIAQPGEVSANTGASNLAANAPASSGLSLTAPLASLMDDGAPSFQPVTPTIQTSTGSAAKPAVLNAAGNAAQQPNAQAAANTEIAALLTPTSTQVAREPASMAQTMIAAQLARSGGEGMAANAGSTAVDPLPPVTGVSSVSQPSSAAAVTQTAAMHRPSAQPTPADQVAVQIQRAVANGETRINIRLHPAELGRVDVDLEIGKDGRVLAMVTAEKSETLEMLQRDTKVLERALQDAGLDTDPDSLNFNLFGEKETAGSDENASDGSPENALSKSDGSSDTEQSSTKQIASDRALDIRV